MKAVLEAYTGNGGKPPGRYVIELAGKLLSIARTVAMGEEQIAALDDIRYEYEQFRIDGMTEKNLAVIRAVLTSDVWRRVKDLPERLLFDAKRSLNRNPKKAAALAAVAIEILILTRAPVRVGNLMSIRLGHNLIRPGGSKDRYLLQFPHYDVKNRIDLTFPLTLLTTEMVDEFIQVFRPYLGESHRGDWLFPGRAKNRSAHHASEMIAKTLEKEVGLRVTAHQFRHAAAAIILKKRPGEYGYVQRVLGHRSESTTRRFYIALESFSATEMFGELVENELDRGSDDEAEA